MENQELPPGAFRVSELSYWAGIGKVDQVRELLDNGADPNVTEEDGYTPLMGAAENNHLEVAKLLIDAGADIKKKGEFTAYELAEMQGFTEMMKLLSNDNDSSIKFIF